MSPHPSLPRNLGKNDHLYEHSQYGTKREACQRPVNGRREEGEGRRLSGNRRGRAGGYRCPLSCLTLVHSPCFGAAPLSACASMIARAVRPQRPHAEPAPHADATSRDVDAPLSIASWTASVVMPRHRQTYISSNPRHPRESVVGKATLIGSREVCLPYRKSYDKTFVEVPRCGYILLGRLHPVEMEADCPRVTQSAMHSSSAVPPASAGPSP